MTRWQLLAALTVEGTAWVTLPSRPDLGKVILRSVAREDGSGRSFNLVVMDVTHRVHEVYVRTVD